jgi:hypothetical protein
LVKNPAANASPAPVESVISPTGATATVELFASKISVVGAAPALITTMSSSSGWAARFKTSASSVLQKNIFGFNSAISSRNLVIPNDLISDADDASIETVIFFSCATAMHFRAAMLSGSENSEYAGTCKTETSSWCDPSAPRKGQLLKFQVTPLVDRQVSRHQLERSSESEIFCCCRYLSRHLLPQQKPRRLMRYHRGCEQFSKVYQCRNLKQLATKRRHLQQDRR